MRKNNSEFIDEIYERAEKVKRLEKARKQKVLVSSMAACLVLVVSVGAVSLLGPFGNPTGPESYPNYETEPEHGTEENNAPPIKGTEVADGTEPEKGTEEQGTEPQNPNEGREELVLSDQAIPLMSGVTASPVQKGTFDTYFLNYQRGLGYRLFQQAFQENGIKNTLISPLSIQLALAMTANGADGATKAEMEALLAGEHGDMDTLNQYLKNYTDSLSSAKKAKLAIANSIWFRDTDQFHVEQDFLQKNADYYGAELYKSPFNEETVSDINKWVTYHTDGMIDKMVDKIDKNTMMYLFNAIMFDAEWTAPYEKAQVREELFRSYGGGKDWVEMMYSEEHFYLENEYAIGFRKTYAGNRYSFVAMLPKETGDEAFAEFLAYGLQPTDISEFLESEKSATVAAALPKFSYAYDTSLNTILETLGMPTAFKPFVANFRKMGLVDTVNGQESLYIGGVLHKTFIEVGELGTRAGAVTGVEMSAPESAEPGPAYNVTLDRPFVYMIIDHQTDMPIFIGTYAEVEE